MEAVFILIVLFLVTGIVLSMYIYYRSRERQMMIERGLDSEDIKKMFEVPRTKTNHLILFKLGIITLSIGAFALFAVLASKLFFEELAPVIIIVGLGVGFILAHKLSADEWKRLNR